MRDRSWPISALEDAGAHLRIPLGSFQVLRIGHWAVIALKAAGLVARVPPPGAHGERFSAEMRFAGYVNTAGLALFSPGVRGGHSRERDADAAG